MGDRWDPYDLEDSRYVWLPIVPDDARGSLEMKWRDIWAIDVKTGLWWEPQGVSYEAEKGSVVGKARVATAVSLGTSMGSIEILMLIAPAANRLWWEGRYGQ